MFKKSHALFKPAVQAALASILGISTLSAWAIENCELNGTPVNTANGGETRGKSGKVVCKDSDTGHLRREFELHDGKSYGLFRFYQMGKLSQEYTTNEKGQQNGVRREWNFDGQLTVEASYKNDQLQGLSKYWTGEGVLERVGYYEKGQPVAAASWSHKGKLEDLTCYSKPVLKPAFDDAKACGFESKDHPVDFYDSSEALEERLTYRKGVLYKREEFWSNGTVSNVEVKVGDTRNLTNFTEGGQKRYYLESTLVGSQWEKTFEQSFTDEDTVKEERKWAVKGDKTELLYEKVYSFTGKPQRFTEYAEKGGKTVITETKYHGNGKLSFKGDQLVVDPYKRVFVGKHEHFFENGQLRHSLEYDSKGNLLREQQFDESGKVVKEVQS